MLSPEEVAKLESWQEDLQELVDRHWKELTAGEISLLTSTQNNLRLILLYMQQGSPASS